MSKHKQGDRVYNIFNRSREGDVVLYDPVRDVALVKFDDKTDLVWGDLLLKVVDDVQPVDYTISKLV